MKNERHNINNDTRIFGVSIPVFVVAVSLAIAFWSYLTHPFELPFSRSSDLLRHYLPFKQTLFQIHQSWGGIPEWNPGSQGGRPLAADPGVGAFYPLALPFYFFPAEKLFGLFFLTHVAIGALLTYRFLRAHKLSTTATSLGTLSYVLNLKLISTLYAGFVTMLSAQAWLPGAFLIIQGHKNHPGRASGLRLVVLLGCVFALQILSGDVQLMIYTAIFALGYALLVPAAPDCVEKSPQADGKSPQGTGNPPPGGSSRGTAILLGCIAVAVGLSLLLSLPLFVPAANLTAETTRAEGIPFQIATLMSLPPAQLPSMLLPAFSGSDASLTYCGLEPYWEVSFYPGLLIWPLALFALMNFRTDKRVLPLAVIIYMGFFFALGRNAPLYPALFHLVPGLDHFRGPARVLPIVALLLALLGSIGLDALPGLAPRNRPATLGIATVFVGSSLAATLYILGNRSTISQRFETLNQALVPNPAAGTIGYQDLLLNAFLATCLLSAFAACLRRRRLESPEKWRRTALFLLVLVTLDLLLASRGLLKTAPLDEVIPSNPLAQTLSSERKRAPDEVPGRVLDLAGALPDATAASDNLLVLNGMNPLVLARPYLFGRVLGGESPEIPTDRSVYGIIIQALHRSRLLDFLRVTDLVTSDARQIPGYHVIGRYENVRVFHQFMGLASYPLLYHYKRDVDLPAAWVVNVVQTLPSDIKEAMDLLEDIDPFGGALVETTADDPSARGLSGMFGSLPRRSEEQHPSLDATHLSPHEARVFSWTPDHLEMETDVPQRGGLLVLSEVYARGWRVEVDGEERPVLRANFLLRAVVLPAGTHHVSWWYDTWTNPVR